MSRNAVFPPTAQTQAPHRITPACRGFKTQKGNGPRRRAHKGGCDAEIDYRRRARGRAGRRPAALAASSPTVTAGRSHEHRPDVRDAARHRRSQRAGDDVSVRVRPYERAGQGGAGDSRQRRIGDRGRGESNRVGGLSPDTTYYYAFVATNSRRQLNDADRDVQDNRQPGADFDHRVWRPASDATARPWLAPSRPNNQATTYHFEYGLTSSYGFQTAVASIPAGSAPTAVDGRCFRAWRRGQCTTSGWSSSHGPTATTYGPT